MFVYRKLNELREMKFEKVSHTLEVVAILKEKDFNKALFVAGYQTVSLQF